MYEVFLEVARMFNDRLQVTPLLFGSLGLEQRLRIRLNPDDIDVLLPERYLTSDWQRVISLMTECGYVLRDEEEHEFEKDGLRIAFASIESLEPFAGVDIQKIPRIWERDVCYLLLSLPDYLNVYKASSEDGYRKNVKNKQDHLKIELIREALEKSVRQ